MTEGDNYRFAAFINAANRNQNAIRSKFNRLS